jgi:hypothetical protein
VGFGGSSAAAGGDDIDRLSHADDSDALMLCDGQQRLVPGDDEFGLGGERRADDYIVIRIGRDVRDVLRPHECRELRIAIDELTDILGRRRLGISLIIC